MERAGTQIVCSPNTWHCRRGPGLQGLPNAVDAAVLLRATGKASSAAAAGDTEHSLEGSLPEEGSCGWRPCWSTRSQG